MLCCQSVFFCSSDDAELETGDSGKQTRSSDSHSFRHKFISLPSPFWAVSQVQRHFSPTRICWSVDPGKLLIEFPVNSHLSQFTLLCNSAIIMWKPLLMTNLWPLQGLFLTPSWVRIQVFELLFAPECVYTFKSLLSAAVPHLIPQSVLCDRGVGARGWFPSHAPL